LPFREARLRRPASAGVPAGTILLELTTHPPICVARLSILPPSIADLEEEGMHLTEMGASSARTGPESGPPPDPEPSGAAAAQRQLLARLTRAEAQLKLLSEQWPGVIFSQRADFSFRFISPRIDELAGFPATDWQRKPHLYWQAVHDGDADEVRRQLAHAHATGEPVSLTYRLRHLQTGRVVYILEHRRVARSPGGLVLGYEGVWLDVTRQTLAELRLASATWKETLSQLTMGLAHDFGNVMAGIHALTESFLEQAPPGSDLADGLQLIKGNARQAGQLVHRIIDLHQGRTGERHYHNLNDLAADLAGLARKIVPRRMRVDVEMAPLALPVLLDAVELRQAALHLVLNAAEAMRPDGRLVLRTRALSDLPPLVRQAGTLPRLPAVALSLQDQGPGVTPAQLPRLFEPFFSTKSGGKGAGLGLSHARAFAEKHHGAIALEDNTPGATTFTLLLPEADFTETDATPVPSFPPARHAGPNHRP
jgi:signal transduction histidine kinase